MRTALLLVCVSSAAAAASACGGDALPAPQAPAPAVSAAPAPRVAEARVVEPLTRKGDVVDAYHGTQVADPYRWLEEGESPDVKAWTDKQNALTRAALDAIPGREALRLRIKDLLQVGTVSAPTVRRTKAGKYRYFHIKRQGDQNQPVYLVRDGEGGKDRVLIDVPALSSDGTTALDWVAPSGDGALVAWGKSESGSEESVLHVRDVATGKDLPDSIPYTRHGSVAWLPDGKAFYYARYPTPGSVPKGDEKYFRKIFFHKLGADPKDDKLVFGDGRERADSPQVEISPDGRWLVVRVHQGWQRSELYLRDNVKGDKAPWVELATKIDATFDAHVLNDVVYVRTNDGAPRYKVWAVNPRKPARAEWREVIPEGKDVLEDITVVKSAMFAEYLQDAATRVERFAIDPKGPARSVGALALPTLGTAKITGAWDGEDAFVSFVSFVVPPQVTRVDLAKGTTADWDRVGATFSLPGVVVTRMSATSKDGARVPMFVVAKEGTKRDGVTPTVMWGYGGFNQNTVPSFNARALATVERGGVWVQAVLRGGGEYGEEWHRAGMLGNKQNVFDDFAACAETLAREKVTSADKLALAGGSNGGLLTSALVTQRPELFRAGLALVPLTDMLRYQHFRIARLWVPEFGSSEDPAAFKWLHAYSPYHRVKDGTTYPSMLYTTAESDSRVDPMHARKMAARLQEAQGDRAKARPILLRVETKAGHGAGKPVSKLTEELSDEMAFLFSQLGMKL